MVAAGWEKRVFWLSAKFEERETPREGVAGQQLRA